MILGHFLDACRVFVCSEEMKMLDSEMCFCSALTTTEFVRRGTKRLNVCLCSGGLRKFGSDPLKAVNDAVEESTNMVSAIFRFAASLVAPEEDEGTMDTHAAQLMTS